MKERKGLLSLVSTGLAIVLLAGCSAGSNHEDAAFEAVDQSTSSEALSGGMATEAEMAAEAGAGQPMGPQVITTGDATVYSTNPQRAAQDFQDYVLSIDGRLDSVWVSDTEPRNANVFAAVPAERYQEAVAYLDSLGRVLNQSTSRQDVGQQVADLDARRNALETSIARLEDLMEQATTTQELLQAEDSLTTRRAELDSLNSQLEWLEDQVEMSSLSVSFTDSATGDEGFTWAKAWEFLRQSLTFVAYALVVIVPWIALIAAVIWGLRFLIRRRKRSKAKSKD